jgi:SAM-dependent methyltransferase
MFSLTADYYDIIYENLGKNYDLESSQLIEFIRRLQHFPPKTLLDIACGTGGHLQYLQNEFVVEGLDLDANLLQHAREKLPGIPFHHANMLDFDLKRKFDVIVCLFSSIGYVGTRERLHLTIKNMQRHLVPGGLLVVEPWFGPDKFRPGLVHAIFVDQPNLKIARMNISKIMDGDKSVLDFEYLIATPQRIFHFTENHILGLFTHADYLAAFAASGMDTVYDEEGLDGRGLYIGVNAG